MSDSKGPKVTLPEELVAELEESTDEAVEIEVEVAAGEAEAPEAAEGAGDDPAAMLEALNEKYLRLAAEFENFKRRSLKERQNLHNYANENLIKELLPVVDNLERAVGHARQEDGGDAKSLLEGIELTYRSLMQALDKLGVLGIEPEGEQFDPKIHEAIRHVPNEEYGSGIVTEVFQKGYLLKDRLIRAALVAVSSGSEEASE